MQYYGGRDNGFHRGGRGLGEQGRGHSHVQIRDTATSEKYLQAAIRREDHKFKEGEAVRLVNIIVSCEPNKIVMDLTDSKRHGLRLIENILKDCDRDSADTIIAPLLQFLLGPELARVLFKRSRDIVLRKICNFSALMQELVPYVMKPCDQEVGENLSKFLQLCVRSNLELIQSEDVKNLSDALYRQHMPQSDVLYNILHRSADDMAAITDHLDELIASSSPAIRPPPPPAAIMRPPGGRHDNDKMQYREIALLPTMDELRCEVPDYLPLANGANKFIDDPKESYLDSLFRLLRNDSIQPFKEADLDRLDATGKLGGSLRHMIYTGCRFTEVFAKDRNSASVVIAFDQPQQVKGLSKSDARYFWKQRSMITYGTIAGLRRDGRLICFASISVADQWLTEDPPRVGLSFSSEADMKLFFENFLSATGVGCSVVLFNSDLNTHTNILRSLQHMQDVPMAKQLIPFAMNPLGRQRAPNDAPVIALKAPLAYLPTNIRVPGCAKRLPQLMDPEFVAKLCEHTTLDESQSKAVQSALTSEVALIQGPPGTGKTFIGSLLARIILGCSHVKILCLCYTNHALDQFLESLIDAGVEDVVRIGSRSKSERMAEYNLNELARTVGKQERHPATKRQIYESLEQCRELREQIEELQKSVVLPEKVEDISWETVRSYLSFNYPDAIRQLHTPAAKDGFRYGNKEMNKEDYVWGQWINGRPLPRSFQMSCAGPLWQLPVERRRADTREWLQEYFGGLQKELYQLIVRYNEEQEVLNELNQESKRAVLQQARVIGATTSGATANKALLETADVAVVIVEEAGEVLEAHIVTSMSANTKHLILIGDHKQLRPKITTYSLQRASGKGYDLDKSTFERLVVDCQMQPATLSVQRRMRPQIAALIQPTYPELQNHPSVFEYPDVRGISRNVLFVHHTEPEVGGIRTGAGSYRNPHEIQMVVEIARLLLLNGYKASQLVILTPYLGNLLAIQQEIRQKIKDVIVTVSEIDKAELLKSGVLDDESDEDANDDSDGEGQLTGASSSASIITPQQSLRTATVDNFQGEESDIVIVSLVRSNTTGDVGFLKEPERVNVLLSRAKHGMILIGNADTLRSRKAVRVWGPILDSLTEQNCVMNGVPSYCQLHPDDTVLLCKPQKFRECRPNGGCLLSCNFRMSCGHACEQNCHVIDQAHEHLKCLKPCMRVPTDCLSGHQCPKLCSDDCGSCSVQVTVTLACGHQRRCDCGVANDPERFAKLPCLVNDIPIVLSCGHQMVVSCEKSRRPLRELTCLEPCRMTLECGHVCSGNCHSCSNGGHGKCRQMCGRTMVCGHQCGLLCHGQTECQPCRKSCAVKCVHSMCPHPCSTVCSSCIEPCEWACKHRGRCNLPCGAPCQRLPCDLRCSKFLECGHRCPTVCGEVCPSADFCQTCGSKSEQTVDMVMMESYREVDVDADPVCILACGHILTISTMDGIVDMSLYYELDATTNEWLSPLPLTESPSPPACPMCKAVVRGVQRYGRVIQHAELKALERKFELFNRDKLQSLSQSENSPAKIIELIHHFTRMVESSPTKRVFEAASVALGYLLEVPKPPSMPQLETAELLAKTLLAECIDLTSIRGAPTRSDMILRASIEVADKGEYVLKGVLLRLLYAPFAMKLEPEMAVRVRSGAQQRIKNMMQWVLDSTSTVVKPEHREKARLQLTRIERSLSQQEVDEVMAAMGGGAESQYGGWGGHWKQCPNGHPYYIGECGGAMEQSSCPECGETVGGGSHALAAGNRELNRLQTVG